MPVDDEEWVPDQKAIVDAVYKETTKNGFYDPYQQSDEELITKNNIANLISSPLGCIESEVDLWCLLYRAVDNLFMKTKRDNISISMDISQNEDRIVSDENSIPTKSNYFKDGLEYGTAECGKTEDALAKKNSVETRLHIPKIMKAMFHRRLDIAYEILHRQRTSTSENIISKGTTIVVNMIAIHFNPDTFSELHIFKAKRSVEKLELMSVSTTKNKLNERNFGWGR
ncbi:hypothetical protein BDC45DRAFT_567412 [Circinella umbellata]|nr:hypothetical protein BDC45DRAFT_567412 [Circinella umbellata]